jgi:hypothetical protein
VAPERKGEPVRTVTDKKAGYSTMCRTGLHRLCIVSTCACVICHRPDTEKWRAYREAHIGTERIAVSAVAPQLRALKSAERALACGSIPILAASLGIPILEPHEVAAWCAAR